MAEPQLRGPRIGDAASLWNFTPAPGWTKEEAQILKLCLMTHGVGRWIQILETGLLPGKLIQQLNGQTQRLLGQQSLAAYTGLQVDIDRIRADNDKLTDAERKNGLVINSGPNLTKQQKQQLQEEAKAKYGLSRAELHEIEEQLQDVLAAKGLGPDVSRGGMVAGGREAAAGGARARTNREAELLARDTAAMSKEEKINFLLHLHEKLQQASVKLARAAASSLLPQQDEQQQQQLAPPLLLPVAGAAAGAAHSSAENEGSFANAAPVQHGGGQTIVLQQAQVALKSATVVGKAVHSKRRSTGSGRRARQETSSDSDDGDWQPQPRAKSGRGRRGMAAAEAMAVDTPWVDPQPAAGCNGGIKRIAASAALAADVQELVSMGFSSKQARDALEEASGDVEAAAEWLVANCM